MGAQGVNVVRYVETVRFKSLLLSRALNTKDMVHLKVATFRELESVVAIAGSVVLERHPSSKELPTTVTRYGDLSFVDASLPVDTLGTLVQVLGSNASTAIAL